MASRLNDTVLCAKVSKCFETDSRVGKVVALPPLPLGFTILYVAMHPQGNYPSIRKHSMLSTVQLLILYNMVI